MKILVVDDDPSMRAAIKMILTAQGYDYLGAESGSRAIEAFNSSHPDLVVLDVMMPGLNGFEVCAKLRAVSPRVPVLFLSAKGELEDKRSGFESGADDYMTKPFEGEELLLRIAALLRRCQQASAASGQPFSSVVGIGDLEVHLRRHEAYVKGAKVNLTPREFQIVALLAEHPGDVFSHDEIVKTIWGEEYADENVGIATYIRHIREKIEQNPSKPRYLQTVWHVGYRLSDSASDDDESVR